MDTQKITATTWKPVEKVAKEMTVVGDEHFKINAPKFIVSPLQAAADLHIISIHNGVENDQVMDTINANEYTQIQGLVNNVEMYIQTSETFYIKF